ncbi:MAG: hypothetical protein HYV32_01585 [Candidatus Kerfeldbacteria bacterium]|nr:hypothetical protein [Candidatus Kerfeldbacteria bacterium]
MNTKTKSLSMSTCSHLDALKASLEVRRLAFVGHRIDPENNALCAPRLPEPNLVRVFGRPANFDELVDVWMSDVGTFIVAPKGTTIKFDKYTWVQVDGETLEMAARYEIGLVTSLYNSTFCTIMWLPPHMINFF